ncbi:signal transduction histidine kinase [Mitsuaria sp. BK045]|uniref:sensor histidine kinase n=1 Tax=unclassified Roseateles TaxID=2626991 RepID=UPI00160D0FD1|nr:MULTISPECIES: histidine kinase [unclassified Roseateles]MBB3291582.1 signal transduction histidine kinase [Mitsuaria sp. BK041]MBB3360799.1 signal transduction histidine kinase [Mitsuaria sp. BK045]
MSDASPSPTGPAGAPPEPRRSARDAALQLFNLRMIAAAFYFCLAMAGARSLTWLTQDETVGGWLLEWIRFTRQTLLTALSVLAALALAEALLARTRMRWPVAVRAVAIGVGAALGTLLRYKVANLGSEDNEPLSWTWLMSTTALWLVLGGFFAALLHGLREERSAQARLAELSRQHDRLQAQQLEAQFSALNAQIEPHFLFNTLANVKRLYETAPERGRDMMGSLIAYLRAALPSMRQGMSTLGQELELARSYLTILQMRMGERLRFDIEADAALFATSLPPMVLPTLVENAIKHGLSPLPEGGRIDICARRESAGDGLLLEVRDTGQGFAASGGSGVGLANTRARLTAMFGAQAWLELEAAEPRGVIARVRVPLAGAERGASVATAGALP